MKRMSDLERKYVSEALDNEFNSSLNSVFNNRLEQAFAKTFGCQYAIGHMNGTATLHTALVAGGVKPGDEVIVPPLTMSSTSFAALHLGAIPVFADVERETCEISAAAIEKQITPKTRAVITVSLFGLAPDYDAILKLCREHNLLLVEDNAQCVLGRYKGKLVGEFGDFASYSFQASKHMTSGEGGMLTTNDEALADKARRFNSLGYAGVSARKGKITKNDIQDPQYSRHVALGYNYRMSELQAAVALGQLERLRELVDARVQAAKLLDEAVKKHGQGVLEPQKIPEGCEHSYWTYAAVLQSGQPQTDWYRFREIFQKNGGDGYYAAWKLSYMEPVFQNEVQKMAGVWQKYRPGLCPNAGYLQARLIQFKTNYWDLEEGRKQAEILGRTLEEYRKEKGL